MKKNTNKSNTTKLNTPVVKELLLHIATDIINYRRDDTKVLISYWCSYIDQMTATLGTANTVKRMKVMRLHVTRYLSGKPLHINKDHVRVDKAGIPSRLGPLKALVRRDASKEELQFLMTLLILSRVLKGGHPDLDLSPIYTATTSSCHRKYLSEVQEVLKEMNLLGIKRPCFEAYHPSTKNGPNGQALLTCVNDAHGLASKPELLESIRTLAGNDTLLVQIGLINNLIDLNKWSDHNKVKSTSLIRKISEVLDPECKTRAIAILDY